MAWPFVILDITVRQDLCNRRCAYCGLSKARVPAMGIKTGRIGLKGPNGTLSHAESPSSIFSRVESLIARARATFGCALVKLSGGELTAIPHWLPFLETMVEQYDHIQLLTNGTCLPREVASKFAQYRGFSMQITLDGVDKEANRFRGITGDDIKNIKRTIIDLVENDVPVELMCVLTRANVRSFTAYCEWAESVANGEPGRLCILPKPVHGPQKDLFLPTSDDVSVFASVAKNLPSTVLPPHAYIQRLVEMLQCGRRRWPCFVPHFVLGMDDRGIVPVCTAGPHLGTVDSDVELFECASSFDPRSAAKTCTDCLVYYELLNLFVEGKIHTKDILTLPSLSAPSLRLAISKIAAVIPRPQRRSDNGTAISYD